VGPGPRVVGERPQSPGSAAPFSCLAAVEVDDGGVPPARLAWLPLTLLATGCATATLPAPRSPSAPPRPVAERVAPLLPLVEEAARRHRLPAPLVLGVIQVESGFNPRTRSSAGAVGLMQLMPRTAAALARRLGREDAPVEDPEFNVEAGCLYLALLLERFDGDLELSLAAYNTGPSRVAGWRATGRPLPEGSRRYVDAVLAARRVFADGGSPLAAARAARASRPPEPDRSGLRDLLRQQQSRHPEPLVEPVKPEPPASAPASRPAEPRADEGLDGLPSGGATP